MMNEFERGSEWRKWDLHIHSPVSICQKYGGKDKWDKFIEALENLPKAVKACCRVSAELVSLPTVVQYTLA